MVNKTSAQLFCKTTVTPGVNAPPSRLQSLRSLQVFRRHLSPSVPLYLSTVPLYLSTVPLYLSTVPLIFTVQQALFTT